LVVTTIVLVNVIVPSQAKVTVPPPAVAARRAVSVQFVTTPPADATCSVEEIIAPTIASMTARE
jgi:hypothetical protein